MNEQMKQWADFFPELRTIKTDDPRIFETPWFKEQDGSKRKTIFACTVGVEEDGKNCFGVDIIKPWGKEDKAAHINALMKMKRAVYYFEQEGIWPPSDKSD